MFDPKTAKKLQTQSSRHRNTGPKVVNRLNLKIKTPTIDINININIDNVVDRRWTWKQITSTVSWQDGGFNWTHRKRLKKWEFRVLFLFNLSKLFSLLCWLTHLTHSPPPTPPLTHVFPQTTAVCCCLTLVTWLFIYQSDHCIIRQEVKHRPTDHGFKMTNNENSTLTTKENYYFFINSILFYPPSVWEPQWRVQIPGVSVHILLFH